MQDRTIWVGGDVGAKSFWAAIDFPVMFEGQEQKPVMRLENKEFRMTPAGVRSFIRWVEFKQDEFFEEYSSEEMDPLPICFLMESTGIYSAQLEKMLCVAKPDLCAIIINPEPIKAYRTSLNVKNKTDLLDSQVIARFGRERKPVAKEKLPPEYQTLKELSRARSFLKDQRTALNNFHDNVTNSLAKRMCTNVSKKLDMEIDGLDREINRIVQKHPAIKHEVNIMISMPGVGMGTAVAILGELGSLKNYKTREQIVALCGLNPVKRQSGISVNVTRLSKKGTPVVRRFLYMCSKTALPRIPVLQDLYNRLLQRGKTRMQARCAVMRKMLLLLRGMVKNDQEFKNFEEKVGKSEKMA